MKRSDSAAMRSSFGPMYSFQRLMRFIVVPSYGQKSSSKVLPRALQMATHNFRLGL